VGRKTTTQSISVWCYLWQLVKKNSITQRCIACGHVCSIDMRHKLTTFIVKNPPEPVLTCIFFSIYFYFRPFTSCRDSIVPDYLVYCDPKGLSLLLNRWITLAHNSQKRKWRFWFATVFVECCDFIFINVIGTTLVRLLFGGLDVRYIDCHLCNVT